MQKLHTPVTGTPVSTRGRTWTLIGRDPGESCALVTLVGADEDNTGRTTRLIVPFDALRPVHHAHCRRERRGPTLGAAAAAVAQQHEPGQLWSAASARIELLDWQLEPALAVVHGAPRVLLADEVGLGKTIEAGLVLTELAARGLVERTLVLVPASLTSQWATELSARFGLAAVVMDQATLHLAARHLPDDLSPWDLASCVITSIDFAKRPEVRAGLEASPFDLLIVDEAHHATAATDRGALVEALATRTPFVVLATATPHDGDEVAYRSLLELGRCGDGPIVVFQRTRETTGSRARRRERRVRVRASAAEGRLRDAIVAYGHQLLGDDRPAARLVATILRRRAASSPAAAARTIARRRALIAEVGEAPTTQPVLPWDEQDSRDGVEDDTLLGLPGTADRAVDVRALDGLVALALAATRTATKPVALLRLLRRTAESAVVFSEYRDTVEDLARRFGSRWPLAVLHGGLSAGERRAAVAAFTSGRARLLLATDAAGEGLNLQRTCRLVVNVDQPWTPVRLEQRAGRVDRLGQTRTVHVLHLVQPGSIEDEVTDRLDDRRAHIGRARAAVPVADTATTERARCQGRRELLGVAAPAATLRRAHVAAPVHCSRRPGRLILLVALALVNGTGRLVARRTIGVVVSTGGARLRRHELGRLSRVIESDPRVHALLAQATDGLTSDAARCRAALAAGLLPRLRAVDSLLERARPAMQGSLFDRRAERAWQLDRARASARRQRLGALMSAVDEATPLRAARPRLVAAWQPREDAPCPRD
ncbi:MAG: DEAD/DEAH box helicase [Vicinamibacterales bacterium]